MTMTRVNDNRCWFSLGPVCVLTAQQFGRSLLTFWSGHASFPGSFKNCTRISSQGAGGGRQRFFGPQGGGALELSVSGGWMRKWTKDVWGWGLTNVLLFVDKIPYRYIEYRWYIATILYIDPSLLYGRVQCRCILSAVGIPHFNALAGVTPCEYRHK